MAKLARPFWSSLALVLSVGAATMTLAAPATPEARKLAKVSPYADAHRWETFLAVRDVFQRLWLHPRSTAPYKQGPSMTFAPYPLLQLDDRDRDGRADFFSYLPSDGSDRTQEFGSFFDLDGNGRTDGIVFYGGLLFDARMQAIMWHHYSFDTNGDGLFDVRVFEAIDRDGDGLPDDGVTAWVYDADHDGLIDKAEHIAKGKVTAITPQADGRLDLGYILHTDPAEQPHIGAPIPTDFFRQVAQEVDALPAR